MPSKAGSVSPRKFHTNDPAEFRDVLEMSDAEIRDRLGVLRCLLLEHGVDPLALPTPRGVGVRQQ